MASAHDIREGMQVIGSDGGMVGRVTRLHGDHIHVEPDAPEPGGGGRLVPHRWVVRVDDHVHLDRTAALARDTWQPASAEAGAASSAEGIEPAGGGKWLWIVGALVLLIALYLIIGGLD